MPTTLIPIQFSWNLQHMLILVVGEHYHWNFWKILKNKKTNFSGTVIPSRNVQKIPPDHLLPSRKLKHAFMPGHRAPSCSPYRLFWSARCLSARPVLILLLLQPILLIMQPILLCSLHPATYPAFPAAYPAHPATYPVRPAPDPVPPSA